MARFIRVRAAFRDSKDGSALHGPAYVARVYDHDALVDDLLGESGLLGAGLAEVLVSTMAVRSWDSPFERHPDLYVVLLKDGAPIFRSATRHDFPWPPPPESGATAIVDLGVFEV